MPPLPCVAPCCREAIGLKALCSAQGQHSTSSSRPCKPELTVKCMVALAFRIQPSGLG